MKHIFISYSHVDSTVMKRVRADLIQADLDIWTDEGIEPGTPSWKDSIEKAIKEASCVIALMSPDAKESEWVNREIDYAQMHKIRVFPVLVSGEDTDAVPFALISSQRVDLRSSRQYVPEVDKLIKSVCQHLEVQQEPETHVVKRARRKKKTWIAAGIAAVGILAVVIALVIYNRWNQEDPPETPLEHRIADADEDLCPGNTPEEYVYTSWNADLPTVTSCVKNLLDLEDDAIKDQEHRLDNGTCQSEPTSGERTEHLGSYWELDYLATGYFNLANRLRDAGYNEQAQEAYHLLVDEYSCAMMYDESEPLRSLSKAAQAELDALQE